MNTVGPPVTVPGMLRDAAQRFGTHLAVVEGDTRLTYQELARFAERASRAYLALGTRPGNRVAIWMPNRSEFIVAMLGALSTGAIVVPMNTRYRGHEAATVLARSRASTLVTSNGFLGNDFVGVLRAAAAELAGGQA